MSAGNAGLSGSSTTQEHYHAFLSHNGADKSLVEQLGAELEKRGLYCWLDKWNLVPGDPWQPAIEQAIGRCDTCVVFFGPHGLGPWHNEEMRLAIQRRVNSRERELRVLPVILPGGHRAKESDLPGFLQGTTWVEFSQSIHDKAALHRLVCGIKGIPPGREPGATILTGECPYLGLKTFQPEDAQLFFGRAAKIQEMIDRLRNNFGTPKEERFLALIGASGSGKSSLALAGLIPAVLCGELPESRQWPLIQCRPGVRPWENLQIALATNQQIASHLVALSAFIACPEDEQRRLHLTAQLALHDRPETQRLLVLIDQFEEIFTLCNDEAQRSQLIDNMLYATNVAGGRTIVLLTMRADFYGQCASYPGLRAAISDHQSLIGPLCEEELREAIESPAQLAGGQLGPGLMELLLGDMKDQAGALPFLEHALFKLWEKRDGRRLTVKAYTDTGRLQGALDVHAEEFFTKTLTTEEQPLCRQVLVDLVHPGEGAADTKKRVLLDDVAPTNAARAVLKKLVDARLVTTDRQDQPEAARAELAHEALISGWRRLGDWVNENRERSRLKERLLDSAREWQKNGKREDFLYRGAQLAITEESFFSSNEEPLPKLAREFLEASIAEECRERNERQLQNDHKLEMERARARAEADRAALAEMRRMEQAAAAKSLWWLSFVLAAVALVALAAATFGFWQKGEAEKQATLAIDAKRNVEEQAKLARAAEEEIRKLADKANVSLASYFHEAGNDAQALVHLAQALRLNPKNYDAAAFTGALLTQTSWALPAADLRRHDSVIISAQFSPDGQQVVTASYDGTARIWDAASGKVIGERLKHEGPVRSAQFGPDGQRVTTASEDGTARIWDAATGKQIGEPLKHRGVVYSAQFSPDGQRVVTASGDGTARLWDATNGKAIGEPLKSGGVVYSAQFSPDGQRVVTASEDGTARLWDAANGKAIGGPLKSGGVVNSAQFSPDGQRVVTASGDGTARVWDAADGKQIGEPMKHENAVNSAQFSPDGQRVVTASGDGTARVWDPASGTASGEPMKHKGTVTSAQFGPNGQRVVTASKDNTARLWDAASGKEIGEPMKHEGPVWSAQFSPDGRRVVTASWDKTARLWDAATGEAIGEPMRHDDMVNSAQFSPDGQRVVTASEDGTARLWDAAVGKQSCEPLKHRGGVDSAQFSPDGRWVVTVSSNGTARLWDATTGKPIGEPMKHEAGVQSARFSPDGRRVVTASLDGTARLWEGASGKAVGEPMKHEGPVRSAQFSPDGQRVVTASDDGTVRLWDAATGQQVSEPLKHRRRVYSAQFSPDGQRVVTASGDETARLWDLPTISSKEITEDVLLLADLAEATGDAALPSSGQAQVLNVLPSEQVRARRNKIATRFAPLSSKLTPLQRFLKWSVSDPRARTISPFSEVTVAEWMENRIKEGTLDGLRSAMQIDPANGRLAAHFGRRLAYYALAYVTDRDEARRARGEADFQTRRALKLAPENNEVKKLRAAVVQLLKLPESHQIDDIPRVLPLDFNNLEGPII